MMPNRWHINHRNMREEWTFSMSTIDIDTVKKMFPKISSKNIDSNFEEINSEFERQTALLADNKKHGQVLTNEEKKQIALFMYATIRAENASFKAKSEGMGPTNSYAFNKISPQYDQQGNIKKIKFSPELIPASSKHSLLGKPFTLYETGKRQKSLGNSAYGDGEKYKGRGYVQLTGRSNYKKYEYAVPGLENNPELADDKKNAAKILVAYMLDKRNRHLILKSLKDGNLSAARCVVNGKPKAGHQPHGLHDFSSAYEKGKDSLGKKNIASTSEKKKIDTVPIKPLL